MVVLDKKGALREGTEVAVEPLPRTAPKGKTPKRPTIGRALANLAGKARNLPPDAARNLDHYLYGGIRDGS
jgi:hypothetical protein